MSLIPFSQQDASIERPLVSLIVCTKNRAASLATCLSHIARLSAPFAWELIVVDNQSTDTTAALVGTFMRAHPQINARLAHSDQVGNGAGRNHGIRLSRGSLLAFTDDDCYVDPQYLKEVAKVFADPTVGFMSGRIMLFDRDDYPITINESLHQIFVPPRGAVYCGLVQGANLAFRRVALDQAGGFDPNFGAGARFAGEDWELAIRVCLKGWAGGYFPGPVVHHHHGRKHHQVGALRRFYQIGEGALYAKGLLDPLMRRDVALLWMKSVARDLFRYCDFRHLAYVLAGMLAYLRSSFRRELIR
jgi:glycosyltransferase involved in cell wall biosynthesis